jgi:lysophospholipase L1-like esterase
LSSIKRFLGNALLTLGALAIAFAIGEVVVRAVYKDESVLYPRYHTDYHYGKYTLRGIRPNSDFWHTSVDGRWEFVTNSRGLRNKRDFPYEKAPGVFRVLSLGDSHTQGYEVRQAYTFSSVLERYISERGIKAEVLNAGVSGFGNAEELAFLENEGYKYKPDAVILGFYANDYEDNLKSGLFGLDKDGRLVEQKYEHIPGVKIQNAIYALPPVRWLSENSYFYSLFFNGAWEYFKGLAAKRAKAAASSMEYAVPTHSGFDPHEVALAGALLERMQAFCKAKGIRLIVVDIPTRPGPDQFASSVPPELRERLNAAGIEFVSAESLLAPYAGIAEMHVPHGHQHISEFTHTLIGAELGRRLAPGAPVLASSR